jgi:NhaP-type Na+/H+ or K+/H+ antiporter
MAVQVLRLRSRVQVLLTLAAAAALVLYSQTLRVLGVMEAVVAAVMEALALPLVRQLPGQ